MSSKGTHSSRKDESGIYPLPVLVDSRRQSVCPSNNNNISSSRDTKVSHPISKANERASQDDPFRFDRNLDHYREQDASARHTNESSANAGHSLFNFEQENTNNSRGEQDLSPIERSFMMLTQNDTASLFNSINQTNNGSAFERELELEQQEDEKEEEENDDKSSIKFEKTEQQEENDVKS